MLAFLLVVLVLFVVGVPIIAAFGGFALFAWGQKAQAKAEANAPALLDEAFDGRADVVYKTNMESMKYETVLLGAKARGYRLANETEDAPNGMARTLIFEKVAAPIVEA